MTFQKYFVRCNMILRKSDFEKLAEELKHQDPNIIVLPQYVDLLYPTFRWIPMSVAKPLPGEHVLATIAMANDKYIVADVFYHAPTGKDDPETLIAWMPLPEPYKERHEDDQND